jgi:predicted DNA-binding protein with PD1-like motif
MTNLCQCYNYSVKAVQIHNGYFLVLDRGEEIFYYPRCFLRAERNALGEFSAIGAVERVEIGYYDLANRQYVFRAEGGPFEVASITGNISELDERPLIHAHGVLSRCDDTLECIGGHIRRADVAVTLEMCMWQITQPLLREYDDDTGLNLISISV